MAIAREGGQTPLEAYVTATGTTLDATFAANVTSGNVLVVCAVAENSAAGTAPTHSVTDQSLSHTLTKIGEHQVDDNYRISIWFVTLTSGGAMTIRLTTSANTGRRAIQAMEYTFTGGATFDQVATSTGVQNGAGTVTISSITTTVADELLFAGFTDSFDGHPWTAGTNFTELLDSDTDRPSTYTEDRVVTATGTYDAPADMTPSGSVTWSGVLVSLYEAGGAPAGGRPRLWRMGMTGVQ